MFCPAGSGGEGGAGHNKKEEGWEGVDDGMRGCTFHPVGLWASSGSKGNSGITGADFLGEFLPLGLCDFLFAAPLQVGGVGLSLD